MSKILIIEDEESIAELEKDYLELSGFEVEIAGDGTTGLDKALNEEFDLLAFLAQNPNHVFTKEELFSKIWDMESVGDIATVTVHIKKIREKIEFNTAKPQYIETISLGLKGFVI